MEPLDLDVVSEDEDGTVQARGEAASKAIRRNFPKLSKAVTIGDIPEELYAQELISQPTFDIFANQSFTDREKGRKILLEVQKTVEIQPDLFDAFCSILCDEAVTKDLAQRLRGSYDKNLEASRKTKEKKAGSTETEEFTKLRIELEVYKRALAKEGAPEQALCTCIEESIRQYVETMLEAGETVDFLQNQMSLLCCKHLVVPSSLLEWTSRVVEAVNSERSQVIAVAVAPQSHEQITPPNPPLFNNDTVYHASICCHAVSTRHAGNFKLFFDQVVRGHHLEEVSMSISQDKENVDRYLIAKQQNTIYIAFQSEATISHWMDKYSSFDDGLEKERERIPVRFLKELLWDQKRIVLTGFSFGGMLACCIAANIWRRSQINADVLKEQVICITFGQPLITIPFVQEVIRDCGPQFEETIYSMFNKEDIIPGLLQYFSIGCAHYQHGNRSPMKTLSATNGTKPVAQPLQPVIGLQPKMDFKAPFAGVFLKSLAFLQDSTRPEGHTYSGAVSRKNVVTEKALSELKGALKQVIPHFEADPNVVLGKCYLTSSEEGHGLISRPVPKKVVAVELSLPGMPAVDRLETSLFRKHNMDDYRHSTLRGFLEKGSPKYVVPSPAEAVKEIGFLKPEVTTIEVHKYPDEVAVVLQGDNLWFCHEIRLGNYVPPVPKLAEHIARRSIQFNFHLSEQTANIIADGGHVKVTLSSHFANPIKRRVKADLEPEYSISLRQMQLAKHTPSEVIELAYLGAMLECHSQHKGQFATSKRYRQVAWFLEEVVKVVPLESIFFAIAYSDDNSIALECSKALQKSELKIPPSEMMVTGSRSAAFRIHTGLPPEVLDQCATTALAQLSATFQSLSPPPLKAPSSHPSPKPTYSDITRRPATTQSAPAASSQVWLPPEIPVRVRIKLPQLCSHGFPQMAAYLDHLSQDILNQAVKKGNSLGVVCRSNIERIYPIDTYRRHTMHGTLQSPLEVLKDARKQLASFVDELQQNSETEATEDTQTANEEMLDLVQNIRENNLKICGALLGSFMEQQIRIPLLKSPMDTAKVLASRSAPVAVGVWALFNVGHLDLQRMLSCTRSNSLTVEITEYIAGILDPNLKQPESKQTKKRSDSKYAGKLQFMLQGIKKTVSCSTQYISYSLERQLCSNPKINKSISVKTLVEKWDEIFKGDALSLVAKPHRALIARWLKWAVLVHDLREALASYTCVGVIGLINSGKSKLVNTLFKVQTLVGTTKKKRTTIPLMYNLDGTVDGLDVIDFPGVDDKDQSIPQLANLLLGLAQAVIFVVDRGKFSSGQLAIEQWLSHLKENDLPVLVCLTHADRLYSECVDHDHILEPTKYKQKIMEQDLSEKRREIEEIGHHPSRTVNHYCFHLPETSKLKHEHLKEVGIGFPQDVGEWIVKTLRQKLDQNDLADRLQDFLHKQEQQ